MTDKIFVTTRLGVAGYCYPGLTLPPKAQISTFSQLFSGGDGILHRIETKRGIKMYQYWFTDGQSVLKSSTTPQDPVLNRLGYVCRAYGVVPFSFTVESTEEYLAKLFS
jgi:hypothetical protein